MTSADYEALDTGEVAGIPGLHFATIDDFMRCVAFRLANRIASDADHERAERVRLTRGPSGTAWREEIGRQRRVAERRTAVLMKKFGITAFAYDAMLERQGHRCALPSCGETRFHPGDPRGLAVDHDHETNMVRGLLCGRCNLMLGFARDRPDLLAGAIDYLHAHR